MVIVTNIKYVGILSFGCGVVCFFWVNGESRVLEQSGPTCRCKGSRDYVSWLFRDEMRKHLFVASLRECV